MQDLRSSQVQGHLGYDAMSISKQSTKYLLFLDCLDLEDRGSKILQNNINYIPFHIRSYCRRFESSPQSTDFQTRHVVCS